MIGSSERRMVTDKECAQFIENSGRGATPLPAVRKKKARNHIIAGSPLRTSVPIPPKTVGTSIGGVVDPGGIAPTDPPLLYFASGYPIAQPRKRVYHL